MIKKIWNCINCIKRKFPDFTTAFFATLLGVFVAFWINSCHHKSLEKEKVIAKLCIVYSESKHNVMVASQSENINKSTPFSRPAFEAVENVLYDPSLLSVVKYDDVYLLRRYLHSLKTFTSILNTIHNFRLTNINNPQIPEDIVNSVKEKSATVKSYISIVQERFKIYYEKHGKKYEKEINEIKKQFEDNRKIITENNKDT